jgi:hypothetical protein
VRELSDNAVTHPVGTTFEYSNVNYAILALIVETVSGQSFESYVQENIFNPLEMSQASYYQPDTIAPDNAVGFPHWFGFAVARNIPFPRSSNGHGGLIASAEDMTHFMIAQLNEGRYGDVAVLSPAGIAEMHTAAAREGESELFYGMGWEVETVNELTNITHNGDYGGFHADMLLTSDGWGIVVMTNANGIWATGRPGGIRTGVISLLRGQAPPPNNGVLFIRVLYLSILSIVALQMIGMTSSLVRLRRWFRNSQPDRRPRGWLRVGWHVVVPLIVNLLLGFAIAVGIPAVFGASLHGIMFVYPDFGYTMALSGMIAVVWIIRTVLAYFALRAGKQNEFVTVQKPSLAQK